MSGAGKSRAVEALRDRGYQYTDIDEPGWSYIDDDGHQSWQVDRLNAELESSVHDRSSAHPTPKNDPVYVRFAAIVLLSAPLVVKKQGTQGRLNNSYDHTTHEMDLIISKHQTVNPMLRKSCTHKLLYNLCPSLLNKALNWTPSALVSFDVMGLKNRKNLCL